MKKNKTIISIVGATGIGKTNLAIQLAQWLKTEILSCDSRQFFVEMPIGTAAPSKDELSLATHHFIGHLSVKQDYSVGQYEKDALEALPLLWEKHDIAILVGGSGMYEKALLEGLNELPETNEENRKKLELLLKTEGIESLQKELMKIDLDYYNTVDIHNPRRLIRAIDIIWQTKKKYSQLLLEQKTERDFDIIKIGLTAPREIIYKRINQRVDIMLEMGLLEEAKSLHHLSHLTALKTVGYNEIFQFLDKQCDWDTCIENIKMNTRRFAKRQLTWYRKDPNILWLDWNYSLENLKKTLYLHGIQN